MAQDIKYGVGDWQEDSHGNHRAVLRVTQPADAVRARIEWRRRDRNPEAKRIIVEDRATGKVIANKVDLAIDRYVGEIAFQPQTVPGDYYVYYLPYIAGKANFDDPGTYFKPEDTADAAWVAKNGLTKDKLAQRQWLSLPQADLVEIQARGEFHRFDPMEIVATDDEVSGMVNSKPSKSYLLFPEDRKNATRMPDDVPLKWVRSGSSDQFVGDAQPGEYYPFQIGVFACRAQITDINITFSDLKSADKGGAEAPSPHCKTISSTAINCINTSGRDWLGRPIKPKFSVGQGMVRALWVVVEVPKDATGTYEGTAWVAPDGAGTSAVKIRLNVSGPVLENGGVDDLWRMSRLEWLNSNQGIDDEVVPPYTPLVVKNNVVRLLDREVRFGRLCMPESIKSRGIEILAKPVSMKLETDRGVIEWGGSRASSIREGKSAVEMGAEAIGGGLASGCVAKIEFDGCITFNLIIKTKKALSLKDMRLEVPIRADVAKYMMGMSFRGAKRPSEWKWKWDAKRADQMVWLGDVDAGLQVKLSGARDVWELFKIEEVPEAWNNAGKGGCDIVEEGDAVVLKAFTGPRELAAGETFELRFRILVTPFRRVDPNHWNWRYGALDNGGNIVHVHHSSSQNPYINYPFLTVDALKSLVDDVKTKGAGVNVYYTVRELSNYVAEMWPLRSLGDEVFTTNEVLSYTDKIAFLNKPGGGNPWLVEHLVSGYVPAWRQPLGGGVTDASIGTQGLSRWHNYYVEGMAWLMSHTGVDGLYLDGIGYDREIMKRTARVMTRENPSHRVNFHSGNNYDYLDFKVSPANQYMEHLPYVSNLWIGEMYDYNSLPDYWLVEISGIPFGLTSEMLNYQDGGNAYRGMLYGITGRQHPSAPAMWKFWDEFGIKDAEWIGYWDKNCPVKTGRDDILATVYKRPDRTLISVASWAKEKVDLKLVIDWKALGLDPTSAKMHAPAIAGFQDATDFGTAGTIAIDPAKGWLITVGE